MEKTCFKCQQRKPIDEFYRHPMMGDGHLGKCKACTKADVAAHRLANLEKVRAYDRARGALPHRALLRKRIIEAEHQAHPERRNARQQARRHHRKSPECCQMCGLQKTRLDRHHPDYRLPLLIVWLCRSCHAKVHRVREENTP